MIAVKRLVVKNCLESLDEASRVWFDIETCRTPLAVGERPDGWPQDLKRRLKPFMICVAEKLGESVKFDVAFGKSESELIAWFVNKVGCREAAYKSRDKFDELVLEGKWTSKYRKRLAIGGGWPTVFDVKFYNLSRESKEKFDYEKRGKEIGGADILKAAEKFAWELDEIDLISQHCLRDVAELVPGLKESVLKKLIECEIKFDSSQRA